VLSTDFTFYVCSAFIFVLFYSVRSPVLQTIVLGLGSFAMYATEGVGFLLLLIANTALTAVCSFVVATRHAVYSRVALVAGIVINLFVLATFKYDRLLVPLLHRTPPDWLRDLLAFGLPIGISFYTFHGISLMVDTWHNPNVPRHRNHFLNHCIDTALYLAFFPQLVAGPISKGRIFFPQIVTKRFNEIPWADAVSGIVVGFFLKRVIADNLNELTLPLTDSRTYAGIPQYELIAMIIGYSAQIFADFAGYSLIAIGVAQLFGYQLPANFNQPYLAQSITDFWRRWHMSLSAWLREYLYFPLGGNRRGAARTYLNLLIVMGLGGLWHGAEWKFAVWGLWHGGLLAVERLLGVGEPSRGPIAVPRVVLTFFLVTVGWLFFRLSSLSDVGLLLHEFSLPWRPLDVTLTGRADAITIYVLSSAVLLFHLPIPSMGISYWAKTSKIVWPMTLGFLVAVVLMASGSRHAFIYFQLCLSTVLRPSMSLFSRHTGMIIKPSLSSLLALPS
jgi:alginate O-acetyltransferase complex protein AlgI